MIWQGAWGRGLHMLFFLSPVLVPSVVRYFTLGYQHGDFEIHPRIFVIFGWAAF
jgi:hypothetical protein